MNIFRTLLCAVCLCLPWLVQAQEVPPFSINMDRVELDKAARFGESTTYVIPTLYLHMSARNTTAAVNEGASAKARVFVEGLDKVLLQSAAKKIYDDLVNRMRAAGYTVVTYEDLKGELSGFGRMKVNEKFGLPTRAFDSSLGIDFVIASPSNEQTLDYGLTGGPVRPYAEIVKSRKAVGIVPQIYFNTPQVFGKKGGGMFTREVQVEIQPAMKLYKAWVWGLPPDLGWCNIVVQEHGGRLAAERAGAVQKLGEDSMKFDSWSRTTADFAFVIDPKEVSTGVLRVGYAVNDLIVSTVRKAH